MIKEKDIKEINTWSQVFEHDMLNNNMYEFKDGSLYTANSWFFLEYILEIVFYEDKEGTRSRKGHRYLVELALYIEGFTESTIKKLRYLPEVQVII